MTAKGLEDTVFYRYYPLASLNEVGGRPTVDAWTRTRFHAWNARRLADWPHGCHATATHDTKRGEDMRARLDVLSEIPREWQQRGPALAAAEPAAEAAGRRRARPREPTRSTSSTRR